MTRMTVNQGPGTTPTGANPLARTSGRVNRTGSLFEVTRQNWPKKSFVSEPVDRCMQSCTMLCDLPPLLRDASVTVVLTFRLNVDNLPKGIGNRTVLESFSRILTVRDVPGFQWNRNASLETAVARSRINVIEQSGKSGIPILAIWLPIVCALLLIILIIVILKQCGFFERRKGLEELMLRSTQAALGAARLSTDGAYRPSTQTSESGDRRLSRLLGDRRRSSDPGKRRGSGEKGDRRGSGEKGDRRASGEKSDCRASQESKRRDSKEPERRPSEEKEERPPSQLCRHSETAL